MPTVATVPNVFSLALCNELINRFNDAKQGNGGTLGGIIMPNGECVLNTRYKYRYDWFIPDGDFKEYLREIIQEKVCPVAEREFTVESQIASTNLLVVKYPLWGRYGPHVDAPPGRGDVCRFTVALRLPGNFEGGSLIFPNDDVELPKINVGDAVICDTVKKHAITPVTNGERYMFLIILHDKE